jgi:hypothetical protein
MQAKNSFRFKSVGLEGFLRWAGLRLSWVLVFGAAIQAPARNTTLAWDASPGTNVASYTVYYGTVSGQYTGQTNVSASQTTAVVSGLQPGVQYYFAATARTAGGVESGYSPEVAYVVPFAVPGISGVNDVSIAGNTSTSPMAFTLSGAEIGTNWTVSATSSNLTLLPASGVSLSGQGTNYSLTLTPATGQVGTSLLTVSATDGVRTSSTNFLLTVTTPNVAPVVDAGPNMSVFTNTYVLLRGRVTDDGLPASPGRTTARWSVVSGPGTAEFTFTNFAVTSARFGSPGIYRLRLSGDDGQLVSTRDVYVVVRALTDWTPPVLTQVAVTNVTQSSATITWTTDEAANTQLEFGPVGGTTANTLLVPALLTTHTYTLNNLAPGWTYTLRAKSRDASGNLGTSTWLQFTTASPQPYYYIPLVADAATTSDPSVQLQSTVDGVPYLVFTQPNLGTADLTFHVPVADTVYVWARLIGPTETSDSFFVSMDGGAADVFDTVVGNNYSQNWQWRVLNGRGGVTRFTINPRTFPLSAGSHTLTFAGREAGAILGRVLVTNDPTYIPADDTPVLGYMTASTQDAPVYGIMVRRGWSMISCPLTASNAVIGNVIVGANPGTILFKLDPATGGYTTNVFDGTVWSVPDMTLVAGEGGIVYNPGVPFEWAAAGAVPATPSPALSAGMNFLGLVPARAGRISDILPTLGVALAAGDKIWRVNATDGSYVAHTYNGQAWDVDPELELGEGEFLQLTPR